MELYIYYLSFLAFPLFFLFFKQKFIILLLLIILFIYARFIEPKLMIRHNYKIDVGFKARYALISDLHLGLFNDEQLLKRALTKVKDVDALFVAGDFTYKTEIEDIPKLFKPFSTLNIPIYAVLGNHDCKDQLQPKEKIELERVLKENNVILLNNEIIKLNNINIVGLGSHICEEDDLNILTQFKKEDPVVVLAHNPDSTLNLKENQHSNIFFTGHTHGGQIRIPFIYKKIIPVNGEMKWNQGLYDYKNTKVFITTGIGEVGLRMRFLIPPTVDIIELY